MDQANWWVMDIVGPAILLIVLIWLVLRVRSDRDDGAEPASRSRARASSTADEEQRRREGTDEL